MRGVMGGQAMAYLADIPVAENLLYIQKLQTCGEAVRHTSLLLH